MASISCWSITGDGGGGATGRGAAAEGDDGIGLRGGSAAGRGGGAAVAGGESGLAVSSSAMIRRMEARISSIDGSCAFAGWLIAESLQIHPYKPISLQAHARRWLNPCVRGESPAHSILTRIALSMAGQCANAIAALWIRTHPRAVPHRKISIIFRRACARPPRCRAPDGSAPWGHRPALQGLAPRATTAPPPPAAYRTPPPGRVER